VRTHSYMMIALAVLVVGLLYPCAASEPQVTLLTPSSGQTMAGAAVEVAVGFNTDSSQLATRVEVFVDKKPYLSKDLRPPRSRGIVSFLMDSTAIPNGSHRLTAKVFGGKKLIGSSAGAAVVANLPAEKAEPAIRFVDIASGRSISGTQKIALAVRDDGRKHPIVSVLVDKTIKAIMNHPPYVFALDTRELANGSHSIEAVAHDDAGSSGGAVTLQVAVNNAVAAQRIASAPAATTDVKTASSATAQILSRGVITTVDPTSAARVSEEPSVPVASLLVLPETSGRSTILDLSPASGYGPVGRPDRLTARPVAIAVEAEAPRAAEAVSPAFLPQASLPYTLVVRAPSPVLQVAPPVDPDVIVAVAEPKREADQPARPAAAKSLPAAAPPAPIISRLLDYPSVAGPMLVDVPSDAGLALPVMPGVPDVVAAMPRQMQEDRSPADIRPSVIGKAQFVGLRQELERAGMTVEWLPEGRVIRAVGKSLTVEFQVGTVEALVNDYVVILSSAVEIREGRVTAPASVIKEITTPAPVENLSEGYEA